MRSALGLALLVALVSGCVATTSHTEQRDRIAAPEPRADVVRDGDAWSVDFSFNRDSPVWVFSRSALAREDQQPWRPRAWTVETPGVRLTRIGRYDVLVGEPGRTVPRRVRVGFIPFARDLIADYDPALVFTDGSVALYDRQFEAFPVASEAAAAALPIDLDEVQEADAEPALRFRDRRGKLLHRGRRADAITITETGGTYLLFGPAKPDVGQAMSTIIDPGLPEWLRLALGSEAPPILAHHADRLGPAPGGKPTILATWAGPTPKRTSMGGSVLPALVTMRFEGEGVLNENPRVRDRARWFIAHEGAHFWLGQAVSYQFSRDAWITEGGADLLAVRTIAALDPAYSARGELQGSLDDCVRLAAGRPVASAQERNEHRAYYACGAMFGLVAEAAAARASGGDFFTFTRGLIEANRADRVLTKDEWLAELSRMSGDVGLERDIRLMVETGVPDPAATLAALFRRAGVAHELGKSGELRLR